MNPIPPSSAPCALLWKWETCDPPPRTHPHSYHSPLKSPLCLAPWFQKVWAAEGRTPATWKWHLCGIACSSRFWGGGWEVWWLKALLSLGEERTPVYDGTQGPSSGGAVH